MAARRRDAKAKSVARTHEPKPAKKKGPFAKLSSQLFSFSWLVLASGMTLGLAPELPQLLPEQTTVLAAPVAAPMLHPVSEEDLQALAATTWAEARSEGEPGMRAVAHVIVNRVGPRFGENITEVVRSPWQFSAWNRGDPNRPLAQNPERYARSGINRETWETAQQVAFEVLSGRSVDPTNGALFYHTTAISPYWARSAVGAQTIGRHIFYSDVLPARRFAARQVTRS